VIKSAIRAKKNVVTTSYVSPAMLELEDEVKKAGIVVMNEIGVSGPESSIQMYVVLIAQA
jgi:saccharopine dehydrogenase-like NADP-dependent oxidoreductase